MRYFQTIALIALLILLNACSKENSTTEIIEAPTELYFPPLSGDEWESTTPSALSWNTDAIADLNTFLQANGTRGFLILKDGKIIMEEYWGNEIIGNEPFVRDSKWYWASAGKTITATLVGIAQEEGLLNIENKTSDYLGTGWTSMPLNQESQVKVKHQLMMTTGLEYNGNVDCYDPSCLEYRADPETQWYYHNAPYTLLKDVVESSSGTDYLDFTNTRLADKIGMSGFWLASGYNNVYWSKPRDMARFGIMILNKGQWDNTPVLSDMNYYNQMTNTSQQLNPSYGYLWWLNGKESIVLPGSPISFNTSFSSNAPDDLIVAAGKDGQFLCISPSQNIIIVRMGTAPDDRFVPTVFHDEMWQKINAVIEN